MTSAPPPTAIREHLPLLVGALVVATMIAASPSVALGQARRCAALQEARRLAHQSDWEGARARLAREVDDADPSCDSAAVLGELGFAELHVRRLGDARRHLLEALEVASGARQRAALAFNLARVAEANGEPGTAAIYDAAAAALRSGQRGASTVSPSPDGFQVRIEARRAPPPATGLVSRLDGETFRPPPIVGGSTAQELTVDGWSVDIRDEEPDPDDEAFGPPTLDRFLVLGRGPRTLAMELCSYDDSTQADSSLETCDAALRVVPDLDRDGHAEIEVRVTDGGEDRDGLDGSGLPSGVEIEGYQTASTSSTVVYLVALHPQPRVLARLSTAHSEALDLELAAEQRSERGRVALGPTHLLALARALPAPGGTAFSITVDYTPHGRLRLGGDAPPPCAGEHTLAELLASCGAPPTDRAP